MTTETKITCDGCGGDITYTSNSVDYRLALRVERMAHCPRDHGAAYAVTDMAISPPMKADCAFCGLQCLDRWRAASKEKPP